VKEVIYKKEYVRYENIKYKDSNPINYISKNDEPSEDGTFTAKEYYSPPTKKHPLFVSDLVDRTQEVFSENFVNPMWSVSQQNFLVLIEKDGDKIAIKTFDTFKFRRAGVKWFKVSKNMDFITVNTKTGDVYVGGIKNYQLKRKCKKSIRRNYFINEPILRMMSKIKGHVRCYNVDTEYSTDTAIDAIATFINQIDNKDYFGDLNFSQRLFKFYLNKRRVKFPNNFHVFTDSWYGPEIRKCLKKCDNKMVDAIMRMHELSGKQLKKALHSCENFSLDTYKIAREMFGDDWLNQDYELILACLNYATGSISCPSQEFLSFISTEELRRVFKLFKQVVVTKTLNSYTFSDHIRMYTELKRFGELDLKWMSSDDSNLKFREEHLDWTDKIEYYRNGTYTRIYPEYSYDLIQKPIKSGNDIYYPVLLDDSQNYNAESYLQSNCVKTYIGKCASIIVSLRKGDDKSDERATVEYYLKKPSGGNEIGINRIQGLGRFNNLLSEEWNDVLFKLDEVMLSYIEDDKFETVKVKKECKNGKELTSDSTWKDNGSGLPQRLVWTENEINKNGKTINYLDDFF
jgi:hypothetical protein